MYASLVVLAACLWCWFVQMGFACDGVGGAFLDVDRWCGVV
jgi:hypothetical protein